MVLVKTCEKNSGECEYIMIFLFLYCLYDCIFSITVPRALHQFLSSVD